MLEKLTFENLKKEYEWK